MIDPKPVATRPLHVPLRPIWCCRVCAQPWPCADARLDLTQSFRHQHVALTIYLATQFVDAVSDLNVFDPALGPPPDTQALYQRMLGWAPTGRTK
ncbi:hypothetical protein [Micromonospora sp. NBC_01796]|uniref:hypothetical protein n=1 Tax=Micromonospora sp. NBC_01796 TaxID=2975987 RepID=UPI002DD8DB8B|nr:hypothetical protein [Micromonospora sp. NBC_01796]WSA88153.1 hypothetical protein OIE47_11355 [Micromonospora sp. NBC_01796]